MTPINIRFIKKTDNPALAIIIRGALKEFGANRQGTVYYDDSTDHLFELFQQEKALYHVAEMNGEVVGGAGIFPTEGLDADTCELVKMYLSPSVRGMGAGKILMNHCFVAAKEKGFSKLTEAVSFRRYKLSESTHLTYVGFALESVMVIEHNDLVIVNINDALNSHHQNVVDMFLKEIKTRWGAIDILLSGWSGAGYFPNTVHYDGKDDYAIGKIREQYFGNHLCKIVKYLAPKIVAPFAPGFALLAKSKQWINDVKFPRGMFESYYRKNFDAQTTIAFNILYPSDYFNDLKFNAVSPYYRQLQNGSLNHLIPELYKNEMEEMNVEVWDDDASVDSLIKKLTYQVNENKTI